MSGGSLDYFYSRVEDIAIKLYEQNNPTEYRAFAGHLFKVAKALHDIEWVMSGDYSEGHEMKSIEAVLGESSKDIQLYILKKDAEELIEKLNNLIK